MDRAGDPGARRADAAGAQPPPPDPGRWAACWRAPRRAHRPSPLSRKERRGGPDHRRACLRQPRGRAECRHPGAGAGLGRPDARAHPTLHRLANWATTARSGIPARQSRHRAGATEQSRARQSPCASTGWARRHCAYGSPERRRLSCDSLDLEAAALAFRRHRPCRCRARRVERHGRSSGWPASPWRQADLYECGRSALEGGAVDLRLTPMPPQLTIEIEDRRWDLRTRALELRARGGILGSQEAGLEFALDRICPRAGRRGCWTTGPITASAGHAAADGAIADRRRFAEESTSPSGRWPGPRHVHAVGFVRGSEPAAPPHMPPIEAARGYFLACRARGLRPAPRRKAQMRAPGGPRPCGAYDGSHMFRRGL